MIILKVLIGITLSLFLFEFPFLGVLIGSLILTSIILDFSEK